MSDSTVQQIKQRLSIVDEVRTSVKLTKKSRNYVGLCPFHKEKTPSFTVDVSKEVFHCFGCGEGGDIFAFVMKIQNISFPQALEYLADKAGVQLTYKKVDKHEQEKNKNLYELLSEANLFFQSNLFNNEGKEALNYLYGRNLNYDIIKKFEIGFATNNNKLTQHLLNSGYTQEQLMEVGLKARGENNIYEVFRNRIIFPIKNIKGQVIAFGGRGINSKDLPKYLNSKDSSVFHKKQNLYALNSSYKNLKHNNLILVEGYLDVINMYAYGYNTSVAPLGTAVSIEQIKSIIKINKTPIICFDGDQAGRKASLRVAKLFLEILKPEVIPKFVLLPEGEDPDSFLQKNGKEKLDNLIEESLLLSQLLWEFFKPNDLNNLTPEIKFLTLSKLKEYVDIIQDINLKNAFYKYFKDQLDKGTVLFKKSYSQQKKNGKFYNDNAVQFFEKEKINRQVNFKYQVPEFALIACVVYAPQIYDKVDYKFADFPFENQELEELKQTMVELLESKDYNTEGFKSILLEKGFDRILDKIEKDTFVQVILKGSQDTSKFLQEFESIHSRYMQSKLEAELKLLQKQYKESKSGDTAQKTQQKITQLQLEINAIKKTLQRM